MKKRYEAKLPAGYREALSINAKNAKFGIVMNLLSVVIMACVMGLAFLILYLTDGLDLRAAAADAAMLPTMIIFFVSMLVYIVLHEIAHGIAYKALTKQKLTFGITLSCAFCGVPHIYTYRRTALIALVAPLLTFTVLLVPVCVGLLFLNSIYYLYASLLFGIHLGGCVGDIYGTCLLLFRFKSPMTLVRDTGPMQIFYLPE